jgi:peptidoglycan/LPS O-acetylase OafA/YrhL
VTAPSPHLPYQPQIDGLRAIAVLAVVLYHFGVPGLPGGFTGVDVFFVISGWLIGGLLWRELLATGHIRLGAFYLRRIRRLAPAFFAMLAVSGLAAWFVLLPFEFRAFGKEVIAATVWLSNVYFWQGTGYFDAGSDSKLLLHTWSLSVEEQFYLILPLALLILFRWRRAVVPVLAVLWALSLAACILMTPVTPTATFYLFPFRAWELLTGVLAAILWRGPGAVWMSPVGLSLIAGGILLIPAGAAFPGWQAMVPVAGAALVLMGTGKAGGVGRLLASRPMVAAGLISYSLYLWHWPVLILSRYWRDGYAGWPETVGWLALAVLLATLSWAFVERPFRRGWPKARGLLGGFVLSGAAALAFGLVLWRGDGLPQRFGPDIRAQIDASAGFLQDWSRCSRPSEGLWAGVETCAIGPDGPPQVIFWGDSHLRALMDGIGLAAEEAGTPGLIIWHAGCPPLLGLTKTESAATPAQDAACTDANQVMQTALTGPDAPETLVIVGRWTYYATGSGVGRDAHNTIRLGPGDVDNATLYAAAWDQTVAALAPHIPRIFVLRQPPELPAYDSRATAAALAHGRLDQAGALALMTATPDLARQTPAEAPITRLVASGAITLIDPWPLICTPDCTALHDGQVWYFDNNHLTNLGALMLRPLFAAALMP